MATAAVRTQLTLTIAVGPGPTHRLRPAHPVVSRLADPVALAVRPLWPVLEWLRHASMRALYGTAFGVLFVALCLFTAEVKT